MLIEVIQEEKRRTLTLPFPSTFNSNPSTSVIPSEYAPLGPPSSSTPSTFSQDFSSFLSSELMTSSTLSSISPPFNSSDHVPSAVTLSPRGSPPPHIITPPLASPSSQVPSPTLTSFPSEPMHSSDVFLPRSPGKSPGRGKSFKAAPIFSLEVPLSDISKADGVVEKVLGVGL